MTMNEWIFDFPTYSLCDCKQIMQRFSFSFYSTRLKVVCISKGQWEVWMH